MAQAEAPEAARMDISGKAGLTRRVAETGSLLLKVWRLAAPYWWCDDVGIDRKILGIHLRIPERWIARGLLFIIVAMAVGLVYMSKLFNDWYGRFYDALQEKNAPVFWAELQFWAFLVFIYLVVAVYRLWLRQLLVIRWRQWLTSVYVGDWLSNRVYYRMELANYGTDNPEQRIEQDINNFTNQTLTISLGLLSEVMTLFTFTLILWNLSGSLPIPALGIEIPGYMMWVAILYALIGSWATYRIGRPLVRVNYDLERYNADFRYRMVRVRENAESIALYRGEPDEERRLEGAFAKIYQVWWDYMKYNKRLTWLTVFYGQAASIFPLVVAAPRYFAGEIMLGAVMQTASAFGQVQGSLSWFVDSFTVLADWKATTDRLTGFSEAMMAAKKAAAKRAFEQATREDGSLALEQAEVALPNGDVLMSDVNARVAPGERVVLQGPSGSGKTTLFRVLAGLWPFGHGRIVVPGEARVLFLPQKPYLPIGTVMEALTYPHAPDDYDLEEAAQILRMCNLGHLVERLSEPANWSLALSPGEQQRVAFARALIQKPDWLFLDEATSALDEDNERRLYELLLDRLPRVTLISIAHKPTVLRYHNRRLVIDPETRSVRSEPIAPGDHQRM
jgi:putative ATP-binding cassette transporter